MLVLALFLRIISNPCANLLQKKLSAVESSFAVNFYSSLVMGVLSLPFLLKTGVGAFNSEVLGLALLAGFLCFLGTVCLIKALSLGELSVLGPVNSYKSIVGLIFAFLFLRETPSIRALFGFCIIICASFLFLDEKGRFILNKSVALRLLALLFTGIEAVILKKIILLSGFFECLILWCLTGVLFSFLFALLFKKSGLSSPKSFLLCGAIGILLFLMQLSTNFVFSKLDVGLSLSLFQLSNIISVFFGFKFFMEKQILKKTIGAALMIFGSFLILN